MEEEIQSRRWSWDRSMLVTVTSSLSLGYNTNGGTDKYYYYIIINGGRVWVDVVKFSLVELFKRESEINVVASSTVSCQLFPRQLAEHTFTNRQSAQRAHHTTWCVYRHGFWGEDCQCDGRHLSSDQLFTKDLKSYNPTHF